MKRALWVVRDKITTARAIDDLLEDAAVRGIFDLVVQVRGRGDAYYASALEPRAETVAEGFDPLDRLVRYGASVGVRIHAWANVFLVWSHSGRRPPRDASHLVNAHPEWLLRPDGASTLDPAGGSDFEGVYTDPANADARRHTVGVFADIARRYRVEGIHYGHVRYPQVTYASGPDDHRHVTRLVRESAARLRAERPGLVISAAVFPDPAVARDRVLQRWPEWAADGLVDLLCPMAYRRDAAEVGRLLAAARAAAPRTELWGGLMGYAGEPERLRAQVLAAEGAGCEGAILFQYDRARRDLLDAFAATERRT
ncbi:MAG TPA: family 10 glycosylhydrolase [Candidatus Limnocylindria bacterium]|nr:family 10 glycosylhydrolase [Candidatus Limnocylindria bacterium]